MPQPSFITPAVLLLCLAVPAARADEVLMAFGERIPPFCFPETNSGIELEIIGAALAHKGHVLKPSYFPFARVPIAFRSHAVAAAMTDLGEDMGRLGAHYGQPAVYYDNVFISLKERNLRITRPQDLDRLTVIAFAGAVRRYPEWLAQVQKEGRYTEQNDQALQVLTLDKGRYDVVLSDRNIFRYFTLQLMKEKGLRPKPVDEHSFVKVNPQDYRPVFWSAKIRDDFNAGLKHIKETGQYEAIYRKYLGDTAVARR